MIVSPQLVEPFGTMLFADVAQPDSDTRALSRMFTTSNIPLPTIPALHEYRLAIRCAHPCHTLIVGMNGMEISAMLDVWAWRLMEVGVHVLLLGSGRNQHTSLYRRAQQAGYATVHYPDAITGMFDGHAALTVIAMRDDATYVPLATVVKLITHDRQHSRSPRAPLVVMLDDVALDPAGRMALTQAMTIWPTLDLSLWMVVSRIQDLAAAVVPQQSNWMDTALRVWFCPYADDVDAPVVTQSQSASAVVLWPPHQPFLVGQVGPRTAQEQRLVTARQSQFTPTTTPAHVARRVGRHYTQ